MTTEANVNAPQRGRPFVLYLMARDDGQWAHHGTFGSVSTAERAARKALGDGWDRAMIAGRRPDGDGAAFQREVLRG